MKRRILFVDHTALLGGGEIALLNLVRHLRGTRYEPVVLLFSDGPLAARLRSAKVETHVMPLSPSVLNASKDALGGRSLRKLRDMGHVIAHVGRVARFIRENRIDLVHTNSLKADVIGGLAARLAKRPLIWHVRDRIANDYLPGKVAFVFRHLCRLVPHYLIANSQGTLRTIVRRGQPNAVAVPSGVDFPTRMNVVHDGAEGDCHEEKIGRRAGRLRVGLVGRISPWKGQHIFLRAAAMVRRRFPDIQFQIIGAALFAETEYEHEVRRLCTELTLDDCVEFTGFRDDVQTFVNGLDVLVHASTSGEPFGQVVIEGMAARKPVVATNGGGIPEIVVDGVTGILVPMGEPGPMADAICQLLEDPARAAEMGRLGQQRVRDHFTIERTARQIEGIYDHLLEFRTGSRGTKRLRCVAAV